MKGKIFGGLLILLLLLPIACKGPEVTPLEEEVVTPIPEVLAEEGFALPEIPRITCEELKQVMDNGVDFVLVDTRLEFSFKEGRLKGAINISDTPLPPLTEEMITAKLLMLPRDKLIVLYCD